MITKRDKEIIKLCYCVFSHCTIANTGPSYLSEEELNELEEIFKDYFLEEYHKKKEEREEI